MAEETLEFEEPNDGEIRQNNFRLNTISVEEFKEFCAKTGWSQAKSFSYLIHILKLQEAKEAVPGRATEIEEFERHSKAMIAAFLNALEIASDAEERVHEEYRLRLESKDAMILELQEKDKELKKEAEKWKSTAAEAKELAEQNKSLAESAQKREEAALRTAEDKEKMNVLLTEKWNEADRQLQQLETLKQSEAALQKALEASKENERRLNDAVLESSRQLELQKRDAEIAQERAVAALEKEFAATLAEKEQQYAAMQIEKEKELTAVLKQNDEKFLELYEKLSRLQDERAEWKEQIYMLQEKKKALERENRLLSEQNTP